MRKHVEMSLNVVLCTANERLVLMVLAHHADEKGRCCISFRNLHLETMLSITTLQKILKNLATEEYLGRKTTGADGVNCYLVLPGKVS